MEIKKQNASDLRPKTLTGLKKQAKQLKKEEGITHTAALNKCAVIAGFTSWVEAHSKLQGGHEGE